MGKLEEECNLFFVYSCANIEQFLFECWLYEAYMWSACEMHSIPAACISNMQWIQFLCELCAIWV